MSDELLPALSGEVSDNPRYKAPSIFSEPGRIDHRQENRHALTVRNGERQAREEVVAAAVTAIGDIAWARGRASVRREIKHELRRAHDESEVFAKGSPELGAKFAIMDDDAFQEDRCVADRPRPSNGGLFGC